MKTLAAAFIGILTLPSYAAILVSYDFNTGTNTVTSSIPEVTADPFIANASINNVARPVIYPNPNGNGWAAAPTSEIVGSGTIAGTETDAVGGNDHFSFKVTPASGFAMNLTQLSFSTAFHSSNTFTLTGWYFVRSSVDNFTSNIGGTFTESHVNSTEPVFTQRVLDLSGAAYQNLTAPVTFRIYMYDNSNSATRWMDVDDVILQGTVTTIPEPATLLTAALPCFAYLPRRRR